MKSRSPYHPYTASDFERYHNGTMLPAERHALEKAALEDPFLADALEGYAGTLTPVADMEAIKERLEGEKKSRRTSVFTLRWWQVAAAFLLVGGAGWLVQHVLSRPKQEVAIQSPMQQEQPAQATTPAKESSPNDTVTTGNTAVATDLAVQSQKKTPPTYSRTMASTGKKLPPTSTAPAALDAGRTTGSEIKSEAVAVMPAPAHPGKDSGSITYLNAKDVPGVVITKDSISNLNVVLRGNSKSNNELNEVNLRARRSTSKMPEPVAEELEPAEGWVTYNVYIAENIREPRDFKENTKVAGSVELSFEVDREGAPVNIKVEQSLCSTCDQEAIRLLKEGPRWKLGKKKKGKILIRF